MNILSYGVKQPQTGDKGSVFFPALEDDLQYLNDHTHDGVTGAPIPSTNIEAVTQSILAASWLATSGGFYRQLITVPNGKNYDTVDITFRITSTGEPVIPTVEKASSTTYYVYTNDNSLAFTARYKA